jgi:hypothetical protein
VNGDSAASALGYRARAAGSSFWEAVAVDQNEPETSAFVPLTRNAWLISAWSSNPSPAGPSTL